MTAIRPKWIVLAAFAAVFLTIQYLNFTGFCYRQFRYYGDPELKDIVIRYALTRHQEQSSLSSLQDFYALNPNCCTIYRWGHRVIGEGTWTRLFGWHIIYIDLEYRFPTQSGGTYFSGYAFLNSCGWVADFATMISKRADPPRAAPKS